MIRYGDIDELVAALFVIAVEDASSG